MPGGDAGILWLGEEMTDADHDLIAAAREALPAALREVLRLRASERDLSFQHTLDNETLLAAADRERVMRGQYAALYRAYVLLLESGRDRIVALGGSCDAVDKMEEGDPALIVARAAIRGE